MNITKRLLELDPTLELHNEGEWSGTHTLYDAFNDAGVECEVGEFLYGMVRILKPNRVLETGTHWGIGASYMGLALKDNGFGELDTIEFLPEIAEVAKRRMLKMNLQKYVTIYEMNVKAFKPPKNFESSNGDIPYDDQPRWRYDMIFLDTEPQLRFGELVQFYDTLNDGGYFFIHDLHRHMGQVSNEESRPFGWPFGKLPYFIKFAITEGALRPFHFGTPRGLTGFYKVHGDDYKAKDRKER